MPTPRQRVFEKQIRFPKAESTHSFFLCSEKRPACFANHPEDVGVDRAPAQESRKRTKNCIRTELLRTRMSGRFASSRCHRACSAADAAKSVIIDGRTWRARYPRRHHREDGGARRDRTDDLLLAKQALSQLSYGPASGSRVRKSRERWWAWEDLNFRPHAYQGRALT